MFCNDPDELALNIIALRKRLRCLLEDISFFIFSSLAQIAVKYCTASKTTEKQNSVGIERPPRFAIS